MVKKREIISEKIQNLDLCRTLKNYYGKKVFSKAGNLLGRVKDVIMANYVFVGVYVDSKVPLFIDKKFFASDKDAIMLSIDPVFDALKKEVFDNEGRKLGKVKKIIRKNNSNDYDSLEVKKNLFKKSALIPKKDIDVMKKSIILNKSYGPKDGKNNNK